MADQGYIPDRSPGQVPEVPTLCPVDDEVAMTGLKQLIQGADEAGLRVMVHSFASNKGANHPDTLFVTTYLVVRLIANKKYEDALPLARHELLCKQGMAPDLLEEQQSAMINVGLCLMGTGKHEEAEDMFVQALDLAQQAPSMGLDHPATIDAVTRLASVFHVRGKHEDSEAMHRRAVEWNERLLGVEDEQTISSLVTCAMCLPHTGKLDESAAMLRRALELNIRVHGLQHECTIHNMAFLGRILMQMQDFPQAERMLRRTVELSPKVTGAEDPVRLHSMMQLGTLLIETGRLEEALPACHQALDLHQRVHGGEHHDTLHLMCLLAGLMGSLGMHAEGAGLARRALEVSKRVFGTGHPHTIRAASVAARLGQAVPRVARAGGGSKGRARR